MVRGGMPPGFRNHPTTQTNAGTLSTICAFPRQIGNHGNVSSWYKLLAHIALYLDCPFIVFSFSRSNTVSNFCDSKLIRNKPATYRRSLVKAHGFKGLECCKSLRRRVGSWARKSVASTPVPWPWHLAMCVTQGCRRISARPPALVCWIS